MHISQLTISKWQTCCKACLPEANPWPTPCGFPTYPQYSVATSVANRPTGKPATALPAHRPSATKEYIVRFVDNQPTRSAYCTPTCNTTWPPLLTPPSRLLSDSPSTPPSSLESASHVPADNRLIYPLQLSHSHRDPHNHPRQPPQLLPRHIGALRKTTII